MTILTGETVARLLAPQVQAAARRQREHPDAFLEDNRAVFGDLADDPRFTRVYGAILGSLLDQGVRKTLADLDQYREDSP
jgi:mannitol 2-dehydrogenase